MYNFILEYNTIRRKHFGFVKQGHLTTKNNDIYL